MDMSKGDIKNGTQTRRKLVGKTPSGRRRTSASSIKKAGITNMPNESLEQGGKHLTHGRLGGRKPHFLNFKKEGHSFLRAF